MLGRLGIMLAAAVLLAGCAADIPYADLEAKYANPASRYLTLPSGVRVHYRDQGKADGPTLVLLHGFSASLHTWEPWVGELGSDYRVVSLDLPGHGLTRVPDGYGLSTDGNVAVVQGVARELRLPPFVLMGNSMGGGVAWNYALAHPDRLRGLVLVNSAGWPRAEAAESRPLAFKMMGNPVGRAVLRNVNPRPVAEPGLKDAYLDESLVTEALVDRYVDFARAPGRRALLLAPRSEPREPVTPAVFGRIATPTLVIHGDDDKVIPVADGRALAGAIPGAKLVTYPKVGHVPMEQIASRSAADVRTFLEGLPPQP
ncbi:alpha/beta hydrolase [Phenylobacterium sp.]|uniref:alpha/beta fold hydrolase n=1 Tax=Phenylobacterium sp. TaxID=1871053 RepID=UPI00286C9DE6|nr:alpha/beta hydrolase [Phenylobacterium sp.]